MDDLINNHPSWEIIYEDINLTAIKNVEVDFDITYTIKSYPKVDNVIDKIWEEKVKANPRLFNGRKFRLDSFLLDDHNNITLKLGITDYKTTLCTHSFENIQDLYEYGINQHSDRYACLANALGVGTIVLTKDDYIVLNRRALWVGESQGLIDTPGGHAEPDEVKGDILDENRAAVNENVRLELFDSMLREVRDEVNIPIENLEFPKLMGIVRNNNLGSKPGLIFSIRCSLLKDDVEVLYGKGGPEADESTEILFLSIEDLLSSSSMALDVLKDMAPCGEAAIVLFYKHLKAKYSKLE